MTKVLINKTNGPEMPRCPQCGSGDIEPTVIQRTELSDTPEGSDWGWEEVARCNACGTRLRPEELA